jgi:two-component system LytT family sensor kinase
MEWTRIVFANYRLLVLRNFQAGMTLYWLLLAGDHALRIYRNYHERKSAALQMELRTAELERALMGAQLHVLKSQLQPHFLFNTLNAVMVLMRTQRTSEAETTLGLLSDLLRGLLADIDAEEIPLRREMDFAMLYVAIEQVRYRDRLTVDVAVGSDTWNAMLPHLALQPLVENAIRHGIGRRSEGGRVSIRAERLGVNNILWFQTRAAEAVAGAIPGTNARSL